MDPFNNMDYILTWSFSLKILKSWRGSCLVERTGYWWAIARDLQIFAMKAELLNWYGVEDRKIIKYICGETM